MRGVFVAAALIFVLMIVIKDGRVLRDVGFTGRCNVVTAPTGQTGHWHACVPGKLSGTPDLSRQGCTSVQVVGKTEYWRCPASIKGGPGT